MDFHGLKSRKLCAIRAHPNPPPAPVVIIAGCCSTSMNGDFVKCKMPLAKKAGKRNAGFAISLINNLYIE